MIQQAFNDTTVRRVDRDLGRNARRPSLGIGSYAYRYGVGTPESVPSRPMTGIEILDHAAGVGASRVLLCENLRFSGLPDRDLKEIALRAENNGLSVECGMNGLNRRDLARHIEISHLFKSDLLRVVVGNGGGNDRSDHRAREQFVTAEIERVLPDLEDAGLSIGLENHFDLPTTSIVEIVRSIGSRRVGVIYDTTNGIGFVESPEFTLDLMCPYLLSVHLKDFVIDKVEAGYLMYGTVLGEGLLPVERILRKILLCESCISLILELTIRRDTKKDPDAIVAWERDAVETSFTRLTSALSEIAETDYSAVEANRTADTGVTH